MKTLYCVPQRTQVMTDKSPAVTKQRGFLYFRYTIIYSRIIEEKYGYPP